jgi:hypothetical protein
MEKGDLRDIIHSDPREILNKLDAQNPEKDIKRIWALAESDEEHKSVRKAAKKALYILKSRGVRVDSFRPEHKEKLQTKMAETDIHEALLSVPDSDSNSLQVFAFAGMSMKLLRFLVHPEQGIRSYSTTQTSSRNFERFKDQNPGLFILPGNYAMYRFGKALRNTNREHVSGLGSLPAVLSASHEEIRHPALDMVGVRLSHIVNPEDEKAVFKRPEIARLSIPKEDVEKYRSDIEAARSSKLIVGGKTPEERMRDSVSRVYTAYFTQEKRAVYGEMLLDLALYFYYQDFPQYSRILIGYAQSLITAKMRLSEHPILSFLMNKAFLVK